MMVMTGRHSSRTLPVLIVAALIATMLLGLVQAQAAPLLSHSTLQQSLVAYWKLDEASGTRLDELNGCGGSGCDLTDNNTVTQNPGVIGNAAQFTVANSEYLSHVDDADLSMNGSFSIVAWVYLDSKSTTRSFISKYNTGTPNREYFLRYGITADRFEFNMSPDGTVAFTASAGNFGSPSIATWYFLAAWYDSTAQQVGISVNNGTADTSSTSSNNQVFDGTSAFEIGRQNGLVPMDGRIDEVGLWKKALTSAERTLLYNSGAGCQNTFETCEGTHTPTPTDTETPTFTPTPSDTPTSTDTPTETPTPSDTPTITLTPSDTPTETETATATDTETPTPGPTPTDTETPTPSDTPTASNTPTETATPTITLTPTITRTPTPTRTPSICPTDDSYSFSFVTTAGNECVRVVRQVTFGEIYLITALFMLFALGALYFSWRVITRWMP
jgi:hypothetical protein